MTVTLDIAKQHLRVDFTDDDTMIQLYLDQAGAIVLDYIKKPEGWVPDTTLAQTIIDAATLMMVSKLYDDRNSGEEVNEVALGYLPLQVTAILHRLRDPALA